MINLAGKLIMCGASYHPPSGDIVSFTENITTPPTISGAPDSGGAIYASYRTSATLFSVFKLTDTGEIAWKRDLSLAGSLSIDKVKQHPGGDVVIAGSGYASGSYRYAVLLRYNSSGTLIWQRKLSKASGSMLVSNMCVDLSGNTYVSMNYQVLPYQAYLVKYDMYGTLVWQRKITCSESHLESYCTWLDSSGDVYVSATLSSSAYILKYTSAGALVWRKEFFVNYAYVLSADVDSLGNIYLAADTAGFIKISSAGTFEWRINFNHTVPADQYTRAMGVVIDTDGNPVLACGTNHSSAGGKSGAFIVKVDKSTHAIIRSRYYESSYQSAASNVLLPNDVSVVNGFTYFASISKKVVSDNDGLIFRTPEDAASSYGWINISEKAITKTTMGSITVAGTTSVVDASGDLTDASGDVVDAPGTATHTISILTKA